MDKSISLGMKSEQIYRNHRKNICQTLFFYYYFSMQISLKLHRIVYFEKPALWQVSTSPPLFTPACILTFSDKSLPFHRLRNPINKLINSKQLIN